MNPDFMIIGAMKSATSSLHDQLDMLPGICMSDPKEPNFFSNDENFLKGYEWYGSLFKRSSESYITGESSTHYSKQPTYPKTIERIQSADCDKTKFIYVIRHPIDRLVSQYIHEWSQRNISVDINEAITSYPELANYSKYFYQLNFYLENFEKNQILLVFYESLKINPDNVLQDVCDFIGLNQSVTWNQDIQKNNVSSERVRKIFLQSLLIESKALTFFRKKLIPKKLRNKVKASLTMKKRPKLTSKSIDMLSKEFNADLLKLGKFLDIDISLSNYLEVAEKLNSIQVKKQ